jgi:hypothetical protein
MFTSGFNKIAKVDKKHLAAAGAAAAYLGGVGALSGHAAHVQKKLIHARAGKDYKEKSFIDKHPYLTGAASLGIAPALSAAKHQHDLDMDNAKVREVKKKHPFMTGGM